MLGGYMYYRFEHTLSFDYTGVDDEKKAAEALAGEALTLLGTCSYVPGYRTYTGIRLPVHACLPSPSYLLRYVPGTSTYIRLPVLAYLVPHIWLGTKVLPHLHLACLLYPTLVNHPRSVEAPCVRQRSKAQQALLFL